MRAEGTGRGGVFCAFRCDNAMNDVFKNFKNSRGKLNFLMKVKKKTSSKKTVRYCQKKKNCEFGAVIHIKTKAKRATNPYMGGIRCLKLF